VSRSVSILLPLPISPFAQDRGFAAGLQQSARDATPAVVTGPYLWKTEARLHRGFGKSASGTLVVGPEGVSFTGGEKLSLHWPFREIEALDISPQKLVLTTYENRSHHQGGDRSYRFDLQSQLPPQLAEQVAQLVGKPNRNKDPDPRATWFATIPAKHQKTFGGSNGELQFRASGIGFITSVRCEARAWHWTDIQTIANPDPYHFRIAGYRETYEFELKQPMSPQLFDRLWDSVYARDLNVSSGSQEAIHER